MLTIHIGKISDVLSFEKRAELMAILADNLNLSFEERESIVSRFNISSKILSSLIRNYKSYTTIFGKTYTGEYS